MSENYDNSGAVENGGDETGSPGGAGGFVTVEPVEVIGMVNGTVDQEPSSLQVDHVYLSNGVFLTGDDSAENVPSDVGVIEDGGKEEMFVDCPDELILSDNREAMAIPEMQESSEEKDDMQDFGVHESANGRQEYKEDRDALLKELANLQHQLKALTGQHSSLEENTSGLVDRVNEEEMGEVEKKISLSDNPLHDMMNECSNLVQNALDVWLQKDEMIRELKTMLSMKGQEIEDLHAKVHGEQHHVEAIADRMLASLGMAVTEENLLDDSVSGKMSHVEKNTYLLIENYNYFLSEIYLLQQCLTEARPDLSVQNDFGTTFLATRDVLLEHKRKEVDLSQKLSNLEDESKKLVEQLDKSKEMVKLANGDVEKFRAELEHEKSKYANTKEKLSLAVTKGKALVQQRDSLKQSLAEKTSELERCLTELQEKSDSLVASEMSKEELVRTEILAASLQEAVSQRNTILARCEEILSETAVSQELQSADITDRIRWLADERNRLKGVTVEYDKLIDALSVIDIPENVSSSDLESRVNWIVQSFFQTKEEAIRLQDQISEVSGAARNEIERLTASLLAEQQEKIYLQEELKDLSHKYDKIVDRECHVSSEKNRMVSMLLEASGIPMDCQEDSDKPSSDVAVLIERCIGKVKEQSSASGPSGLEAEVFETIQTLLYVKDQELMLCEKLLEEDVLLRSKLNTLSDKLRNMSQEIEVLKDEKNAMQKDLERSEDKSALLREKLSMAVKKGKGLVQDRENLKKNLDEKTAEIDKLKLELQQQESALGDFRDQISILSTDVEVIPKLESDLTSMKDQKDQLEQFLVESNNLLQRVMESIDGIVLPIDSTFEEPAQKLQWLAGYLNECQVAKKHMDQELEKLKEESAALSNEIAEAYIAKKSLEVTLSLAENNISRLAEEKRELEVAKTYGEQELQKALEEASAQAGKFAEACSTRKSLEDALSEAEDKISDLMNEKEEAHHSRASAETELKKVKEEVLIQTGKLTEAYGTIKSLEDALSQVETNVALLSEENNNVQVGRTNLENEMKKLKEEADSQSIKLTDSYSTIKLLEDALLKAENNVSELVGEQKKAGEEIVALNTKLNVCMEELAGTTGSLDSRSLELSSHLNSLQLLLKDDNLLSLLKRSFELKLERLRDMDVLLEDMKNHYVEMQSEPLQSYPAVTKEDSDFLKFAAGLDNIANGDMNKGHANAEDGDSLESYFSKTVEGFHLRNKILADNVEGYSAFMDEFIAALLTKLLATRDGLMLKGDQIISLKQKVDNLEMVRQAQESKIVILENDISILLSACTDATNKLEAEIENNPVEVSSVPEMREVSGDAVAEHQTTLDNIKYLTTAKNLSLAARKVGHLIKQFGNIRNESADAIKEFENNLTETRISLENAIEERDLNQSRISKLESDVEALQKSYQEVRFQVEDYEAKEDKMNDKEAEISSLRNALSTKEKEAEEAYMSASQVKSLYDKLNDLEVPFAEFKVGDTDFHNSDHAKKLFYIIDVVTPMLHHMNSLSHEKEELQSTLVKQVQEIEHLKEKVEQQNLDKQDYENMKNELFELEFTLESIIQKLGGNDLVEDPKTIGVRGFIPVLEKLVMAVILESENSKSKAQELSAKLLGSQKVVDELSNKVKFLEDSKQGRSVSPEVARETSIFEASSLPTRSEITEIEDAGPIAKKAVAPAAFATHARTLRKGSNDHLAIDIDSESDRLIKNKETDEDKGHIFKPLNTSGLVPLQGKMIADRIDGLWVSGGRALMSRPRARLGLMAYWLLLHIWLLATL
ncbi:hypothetical protein RHGRI_033338 [Rhododendron griersonianum]|uniref:Uncharacterized protein n=1 Tax=Rhododendron griersonianum TaxID=479676 RepID=A0AAV6I222_9ERIC|nr:hypothetical protein RHGRI_033338 [Rhododendron griersonianum]